MNLDLESILISLPGVLLGLVLHEFAHAWAADRLGDPTPRSEGRLSLNPLRHLDPLGFIFIVVAGFGWAKPVRFSREALAKPRRDESLIAVAGPLMNLALGLLLSVLTALLFFPLIGGGQAGYYALQVLLSAAGINFALMMFNMLPIPPLDGSHVLFSAIRIKPETEVMLYRYGTLALFAVIILGNRLGADILPVGKAARWMLFTVLKLFGIPV